MENGKSRSSIAANAPQVQRLQIRYSANDQRWTGGLYAGAVKAWGVFFNNLFHSSESAFRTSGLDMYACISIGMYVGVPIG